MVGIVHKAIKSSRDTGLATEWNDDHEQTGNHDCAKFQHLNHVIENRTDWPAGPVEGQIVWRTDLNALYVWDGSVWGIPNPTLNFTRQDAQPTLTESGEVIVWSDRPGESQSHQYNTPNPTVDIDIFADNWAGATFTWDQSEIEISAVRPELKKAGVPGDLHVAIYNADGADRPTGDPIIETTYQSILIGGAYANHKITLPTTELTAGNKYAVVLHIVGGDNANKIQWKRHQFVQVVGTKSVYSINGGVTWVVSDQNHNFDVYGYDEGNTYLVVHGWKSDVKIQLT